MLKIMARAQRSICAHSKIFKYLFLFIFYLFRAADIHSFRHRLLLTIDNAPKPVGAGQVIDTLNSPHSCHSALKCYSLNACLHGQRVGKTPDHGHTRNRTASGRTADSHCHKT